ncbi:hypothetical protein LINGRAHAP2_LOCUS3608 [Linum grandiflorum]
MATAPLKSQSKPLHNFPLPLKWSQTAAGTATNSRTALPPEAASDPDAVVKRHRSPSPSQATNGSASVAPHPVGSRSARQQRFAFSSCSKASTILLSKPISAASKDKQQMTVFKKKGGSAEEAGDPRPWKLRPRRGLASCSGNSHHIGELANQPRDLARRTPPHPPPPTKSNRPSRGSAEAGADGGFLARKEKRKFWIALSKEEIEEDVYSLTGSRPSRRPQKRPKNVQKSVDNVFPGLWLVGSTVDSYKSPDPPIKR